MDSIQRVRAARGAVNMSLDKFASAIGMGRTTLVRIENGSREPDRFEYAEMARVSGLPLGFFLAEDLEAVLDGADDATLRDRVADLEAQVHEIRAALAAVADMAAADDGGRVTPSVTERARAAAQRLAGTPEASPGTDAAPGVEDQAT